MVLPACQRCVPWISSLLLVSSNYLTAHSSWSRPPYQYNNLKMRLIPHHWWMVSRVRMHRKVKSLHSASVVASLLTLLRTSPFSVSCRLQGSTLHIKLQHECFFRDSTSACVIEVIFPIFFLPFNYILTMSNSWTTKLMVKWGRPSI